MSERTTCSLFLLVFAFCIETVHAQRTFLVSVRGQQKSYAVTHVNARDDQYNLPLVVLALNAAGGKLGVSIDDLKAQLAGGHVILAAPFSLFPDAGCSDINSIENNLLLLQTIIEDAYNNFRIDRNRVFVIGSVADACLMDSLVRRYPGAVSGVKKLNSADLSSAGIARALAEVLTRKAAGGEKFQLWSNPLVTEESRKIQYEDSIRQHRWQKRTTVEFRFGRFDMLGSVKTDADRTYMDVTDAHAMQELHINRWMSDSFAWFLDIGRLKVPQRQEFNGARIEMGGGMIMFVTYGLKYTFYRHKLRPYVSLATGPLSFMVFGGKFSQNSDPSQAKNNIEAEVRTAMQTRLGVGIEGRLGKRIALGAHVIYIHSSAFESAGSVRAIRGFDNSLSFGYILGANRLK